MVGNRGIEGRQPGEWLVHGERTVYSSDRLDVVLADVEEANGDRVPEHHLIRCAYPASACLIAHPDKGVLLIRRHRFIVRTWGWEVPAGGIDRGESAEHAAARELLEETGWRPVGPLTRLYYYHPAAGLLDHTYSCFFGRDAELVGEPTSTGEAAEVAWLPAVEVARMVDDGEITDGLSFTALLVWLRRHGAEHGV